MASESVARHRTRGIEFGSRAVPCWRIRDSNLRGLAGASSTATSGTPHPGPGLSPGGGAYGTRTGVGLKTRRPPQRAGHRTRVQGKPLVVVVGRDSNRRGLEDASSTAASGTTASGSRAEPWWRIRDSNP